MTVYIAVDSSLSMSVGEETDRFQYASELAAKVTDCLVEKLFKRKINLVQFSHNSSVLLHDVKSGTEILEKLASVKVAGSSDLLSLFSLMKMEKAGKDSVLVVIADASSFTTEEIKFSHLPECPIVVACVLNEFKADTGQIARFMFLSAQVDGLSMSSLMKKGVFERYKPLFKSDFENVDCFATALSEIIIPCRELVLRCGMLSGTVQIVPANYNCRWEDLIEIIGFVRAVNLGNIPTSGHHFLKYREDRSEAEEAGMKGFLNLLCNTLISEEMAAVCRLNSQTYGVIGAVKNEGTENCLLIQHLPNGIESVYWIRNLERVISKPLVNDEDFKLCLPSDGLPKPSYSSQRTIWDDSFGIQSDMQKILRLLKKIPDRTLAFYAELNRVHGYACTIGAEDIHNKLVDLVEAEAISQPPIVKKHSAYVCAKLRDTTYTLTERHASELLYFYAIVLAVEMVERTGPVVV